MNIQTAISNLKQNADRNKKAHQKLIHDLKKLKSFEVDELFHTQHEIIFDEIDCLQCANCCKTTPALLLNEDINRISKHLHISVKDFMQKYVVKDEDGDLVFKTTPCVFLGEDNFCSIYDIRPIACKEYPHTNRKKMVSILDLTVKNTEICPAVATILNHIENSLA